MKKRLLSILLAASLVVMSLTGCGDVATGSDDRETTQESEQPSSEQATEAPTEAPTPEPTEEPTPEPTEEPTPEPTEAPTPEPTEAPTPEPTEAPTTEPTGATGEWATAYEGYFEREDIMPEKFQMDTEISQDGITFGMIVASADQKAYMRYDFGGIAMDIYADEANIYTCTEMAGETSWMFVPITSEEDVDSVISMEESGMVDTDTFTSYGYKEEVTEDGVVYDVLTFESDNDGEATEGLCYINRETQKMEKMVVDTEAGPAVFDITEIDGIEIPAEAATATEGTQEDLVGAIFGVIMMGALSGMDLEGMTGSEGGEITLDPSAGDITFTPADGVEVVEDDTEKTTGTDDGTDWSIAYDSYFEGNNILPEKMMMTTSISTQGVAADVLFAQDGVNCRMTYDFGSVIITLYADDANVYLYGEMGTDANWMQAPVADEADRAELVGESITEVIDADSIISQTYREAINEDGLIYDVIDVLAKEIDGDTGEEQEQELTCFINRGTQLIDKLVITEEDNTAVCFFEEIDAVVIPDEAKNAEVGTAEELEETMSGLLLIAVMSAMGVDASQMQ